MINYIVVVSHIHHVLAVALLLSQVMHLNSAANYVQVYQQHPHLIVEYLEITPIVLKSGDVITVSAVITNKGTASAVNLRIGIAVLESPGKSWTPLEKIPEGSIAELAPGETQRFRGTARLEGNGWFRVGIAGTASNSVITPVGQRIRVVEPGSLLSEIGGTFGFFALITGLATLTIWWTFRAHDGYPLFSPGKIWICIGLAIMLVVPAFLWSIRDSYVILQSTIGGIAAFAMGWIIIGTALRPRHSTLRGFVLAAVLYLVIGLNWGFVFNSVMRGVDPIQLLNPRGWVVMLGWPLQLAQLSGLFGLTGPGN